YDEIMVPDYLLEEAGIPIDAKLCAYTEEDSGEVVVMQADYDYDIADVPNFVFDIFEMSGICFRELEEKLMTDNIVYGDEYSSERKIICEWRCSMSKIQLKYACIIYYGNPAG